MTIYVVYYIKQKVEETELKTKGEIMTGKKIEVLEKEFNHIHVY